MWFEAAQECFADSLNLIAYCPLRRGTPIAMGHPVLARHLQTLRDAAEAMWKEGAVQKRMVVTESERLQVYFLPTSDNGGVMLVWDLSPLGRFLQQYRMSVDHVYRDVFYAATGGRLILVRHMDMPEWIGQTAREWFHPVTGPGDIELCRRLVTEQMSAESLNRKLVSEMVLCVSEATTNALKHAGGGELRLMRTAEGWLAGVSDHGPGIDISLLPHSALLQGFSTRPSLGLGFTAIVKCMDRVVLSSSPEGVSVLLCKLTGPAPTA